MKKYKRKQIISYELSTNLPNCKLVTNRCEMCDWFSPCHQNLTPARGPKDPSFALTQNIPYKQDAETSQQCSGNPPHRDSKTVFRSVSLWTTLRNERCWTLALFIPPATAVYGPQQPKNRVMEKAREERKR